MSIETQPHGHGAASATVRSELDDDALLAAFESAALPPASFHHRDHVRVAWICCTRYPPEVALARFCDALRRFAAAHGAAEKYHATLTWAFVLLVGERIARGGACSSFDEFARRNADLLDWQKGRSVLDRFYRPETLASAVARARFVMPDRGIEPSEVSNP